MEWYQVLMIILSTLLSTIGMGWVMFINLGNKIDRLSDDMKKEMKDFHGRLCALEEKYRQTIHK
jgi:hypothetical protein